MLLELKRTKGNKLKTNGELYLNGEFFCYTLEDPVRIDDPTTTKNEGEKIWGNTAIGAGIYRIIVNWSQRFKRQMLRLLGVPEFTGILIHGGNTVEDTHGCILVGDHLAENGNITPGTSTKAFNRLYNVVEKAFLEKEEIKIKITNEFLDRL